MKLPSFPYLKEVLGRTSGNDFGKYLPAESVGLVWPLLLAVLTYFPCFLQLRKEPIRQWDESRLAINAVEMLENGWSHVTTFRGEPDMWNTKPPLMIWLQVLFLKITGIDELGIRLPAALAGALTTLLLFVWCWKVLKVPLLGLVSSCVLLSTGGYIAFHVVRTGDYDSLLILFTTLIILLYYQWLMVDGKPWQIMATCLVIFLAILTKGITCFIFFPGMFLFALLQGKLGWILRDRFFWMGLFLLQTGTLAYYLTAEAAHPGYLKAVWENEIGGRMGTTLEGHLHPFDFYIKMLFDINVFYIWWVFALAGIVFALINRQGKIERFVLYLALMSLSFLLIISSAATKLEWYKAPMFPLLSVVAAYGFLKVLSMLASMVIPAGVPDWLVGLLFFLMVFAVPYYKTVSFAYEYKMPDWEKGYYGTSKFIRYAMKNNLSLDGHIIAVEGYQPHFWFYEHVLRDNGQKVQFQSREFLKEGDVVVADMYDLKLYVEEHFVYELLHQHGSTNLYRLVSKKEPDMSINPQP